MMDFTMRGIFICTSLVTLLVSVHCDLVKQLERQVKMLAGNQHLESMSRKEDTANILERLQSLEKAVNESIENATCSRAHQSGDTRMSDRREQTSMGKNDVERLTEAFKEEKSSNERLRRQVPKIAEKVETVDRFLESITGIVVSIRENMCTTLESNNTLAVARNVQNRTETIVEEVQSIRSESGDILNSTNAIKNEIDTVSNAVQMIEKMTMSIIDKFDNITSTISIISAKIEKMENNAITSCEEKANVAKSCLAHYNQGERTDGLYYINIGLAKPIKIYCDMTTDGGGWTVFQRRKDGSVDFFRGWQDYKEGFGNLCDEFWLGNDYISALTSTCCHELRIELEDFENNTRYAKYGKFQVLTDSENYELLVSEYSGDAGDSMTYHNGMPFTTKDRDNDLSNYNCAALYKAAWWYNNCYYSNLNGLYLKGADTANSKGINWKTWRGYEYSLKTSEMKLR